MQKEIVQTDNAPRPIGPYSQAIRAGNFLFLSGQIAIDPKTGEVIKEPFAGQCKRVIDNVKAVLEAAGSGLKQVVKVTVFLRDLKKFEEFNKIYGEYFGESKPARSCVEVSALPKGVDVEIEALAICENL